MIDLLCTVYMICWFSLCNQFPSSFQCCSFYSLSCCYFYFSSFTCQFYCIRTSKTLIHLIAFLNAHIRQVDATGTLRISVQLLLNFALTAQMPKFWLKHGVLAHTSHMKQYSWVKHSQVSELCSEPGQLMQLVWRTSTTIPTVVVWCAVGTVTDRSAPCCLSFPEQFSGKKYVAVGCWHSLCSFLFGILYFLSSKTKCFSTFRSLHDVQLMCSFLGTAVSFRLSWTLDVN